MDLTPIILGIAAVNLGALLAGTLLAARRARHGRVDVVVSRGRAMRPSTRRQTALWTGRPG